MKPFDKMNKTTARLFLLVVLVFVILCFTYGSRFLYTGVQDAFELSAAQLKKKKQEEETNN